MPVKKTAALLSLLLIAGVMMRAAGPLRLTGKVTDLVPRLLPAGAQAIPLKNNREYDLLTTFRQLDVDNQIIILGETKKALRDQRREKLAFTNYQPR